MSFTNLKLSEETQQALKALKFQTMTPIQERAIPILLSGKDIIGQADTGTGKTAAFAIPTIEALDPKNEAIQAVVMCPTRELCCQVAKQFSDLMKFHKGFKCVPIYGGQKMGIQLKEIRKKPQVIIGTPGRLLDHIRRGSIKLRAVKIVVLDEADLMLGMGFKDDIETILKSTKERKQTILFSATMQPEILKLAQRHQNKAQHINVKKKEDKKANIKQIYCDVDQNLRKEAIKRLLFTHEVKSALIFCNTKRNVDKLFYKMKDDGFSVDRIHGDIKQNKRDAVMRKFRSSDVRILIATDVAARGIDVNDIGAVFNYNIPRDSEDYVHRIGRTGRAGKTGLAFSFTDSRELQQLKRITTKHKMTLEKGKIPSLDNLGINSLTALQNIITDGTLEKKTGKKHLKIIKDLKNQNSDEKAVIKDYITSMSKGKTNILGAGIR